MALDVSEFNVHKVSPDVVYLLEDILVDNWALVVLGPLSILRKSLPLDYPDVQGADAEFRVRPHFDFFEPLFFRMP